MVNLFSLKFVLGLGHELPMDFTGVAVFWLNNIILITEYY